MKGRNAILILLGIFIVLGAVAGIIAVQLFYRQPFISQSTLAGMGSLTPVVELPAAQLRLEFSLPHQTVQIQSATPASFPGSFKHSGSHRNPRTVKRSLRNNRILYRIWLWEQM